MILSISKIFWLLVILASVWYIFKIIEKRKIMSKKNNNNEDINKKAIHFVGNTMIDSLVMLLPKIKNLKSYEKYKLKKIEENQSVIWGVLAQIFSVINVLGTLSFVLQSFAG